MNLPIETHELPPTIPTPSMVRITGWNDYFHPGHPSLTYDMYWQSSVILFDGREFPFWNRVTTLLTAQDVGQLLLGN